MCSKEQFSNDCQGLIGGEGCRRVKNPRKRLQWKCQQPHRIEVSWARQGVSTGNGDDLWAKPDLRGVWEKCRRVDPLHLLEYRTDFEGKLLALRLNGAERSTECIWGVDSTAKE